MLKIQLVTKHINEIKAEYIVFPVFEGEKPNVREAAVDNFYKDNPKFGRLYETQTLYLKDINILLVGAGKKDKYNYATLQNVVGTAVKSLSKIAKSISIVIPYINGLNADEVGEAIAIGAEIALYDPTEGYKSDHTPSKLNSLEIVLDRAERGYLEGIRKGQVIAEGINLVKRLGDMPPNEMTPTYFLNEAKKLAKDNKLKLTVLDEKQAKKKGMGAFVGVAQGSDEPSYMIALEYKGDARSKEKWGLVGKGITYDSGGLSLKPSDKMTGMKYDMLGATTVVATIFTAAKLGLRTNIVAVMPVTENMPSGRAFKPDDILRTYSGKTVEIFTTDAEGRIVLSDALTYVQKDYKATKLVDVATLTGAIVISLGDFITGAFSNDPKFVSELIKTGAKVGEKYWEMPMDEEFDEMLKGKMADLNEVGHGGSAGTRTAGATMGAKFIQQFVEDKRPWIHLDIGGTGEIQKPVPYASVGATGAGVKTLVRLIES